MPVDVDSCGNCFKAYFTLYQKTSASTSLSTKELYNIVCVCVCVCVCVRACVCVCVNTRKRDRRMVRGNRGVGCRVLFMKCFISVKCMCAKFLQLPAL